jgi:hypothetical protein
MTSLSATRHVISKQNSTLNLSVDKALCQFFLGNDSIAR